MEREIILQLHSIIGVIIFIIGILQILLKKGGAIHKIIGQVYLYSWLILLISGAYLGGALITTIGIFGFYFALTGSRIGHLKTKAITLFEKSIFSIGGLVAISMLYYSINLYLKGQNSFATIFLVFGLIFLFTTIEDIAKYIFKKPIRKQKYGKSDWYFEHLKRMCISFIAAVTAFTSIQNVFNNNTLNFLIPTIVGVILINLATKSYKKKLLK
ncbi:MAG: hypothetical protein COA67_07745 [Lutibacter sp.]|nr:MAG: hypothetical protein COA67_07745 [Lutibacter sp.]